MTIEEHRALVQKALSGSELSGTDHEDRLTLSLLGGRERVLGVCLDCGSILEILATK